jgi:hypothetical protein
VRLCDASCDLGVVHGYGDWRLGLMRSMGWLAGWAGLWRRGIVDLWCGGCTCVGHGGGCDSVVEAVIEVG